MYKNQLACQLGELSKKKKKVIIVMFLLMTQVLISCFISKCGGFFFGLFKEKLIYCMFLKCNMLQKPTKRWSIFTQLINKFKYKQATVSGFLTFSISFLRSMKFSYLEITQSFSQIAGLSGMKSKVLLFRPNRYSGREAETGTAEKNRYWSNWGFEICSQGPSVRTE